MIEVSVVIPTKNEEKQISTTLNHILNQSFSNFEVIVSDGDSEDNTKSIVESYKIFININISSSMQNIFIYT